MAEECAQVLQTGKYDCSCPPVLKRYSISAAGQDEHPQRQRPPVEGLGQGDEAC